MSSKPLTVSVQDGVLFIEIGVNTLAHAALHSDWAYALCRQDGAPDELLSITDPYEFAKEVKYTLTEEGEDGESMLSGMLDRACEQTINDGSEFFVDKRDQ